MTFTHALLVAVILLGLMGCGDGGPSSPTTPSPPPPPVIAPPPPVITPQGPSSLFGITYVYPSKPGDTSWSAYGGIQVELLDGPFAGAVTFSNDDDFGMYIFKSLPSGLAHVRASRLSGTLAIEEHTAEVVVDGPTRLDFVFK